MDKSAPGFRARAYYRAKPFIPGRLRWALRRGLAQLHLLQSANVWPIDKKAGTVPSGWPGWPQGKSFALVLTHDVESRAGLEKVRRLAEFEMELGFRSAFNFVPEGSYRVPDELRSWLTDHGFEVGVHDLHHDGNLYESEEGFREKAERINGYLGNWGAVGFRSGFMLRRLDWLRELKILYDSSTFDTDPFEPQPEGVRTIFPFRVTRPGAGREGDFIEMPYTLPQDSTLYLLLRKKSPVLWWRKLSWIAKCRGMALVNVHPDYMHFGDVPGTALEYPAAIYREFLEGLKRDHDGAYWHALPREVAAYANDVLPASPARGPARTKETGLGGPIWIDLDNTPHVPFFRPIIRELRARGCEVLVTARDAFLVRELADRSGLTYLTIGRHDGRHLPRKVVGLLRRAMKLLPVARRERPVLAVSHGSRAQLLASRFLGLPSLELTDYEHAQSGGVLKPTWLMGPEALAETALVGKSRDYRSYPGLKEDVYAWSTPRDGERPGGLDLEPSDVVMTVRPPATEAHYHNPRSEALLERVMERALREERVRVILLPRNAAQEQSLRRRYPAWFDNHRVLVPEVVLDGMELIAGSDLVVSGGGTMSREAVALGVPSYSIFSGKIGAVDQKLADEGRLTLLRSDREVDEQLLLRKRPPRRDRPEAPGDTLNVIIDTIIELARRAARGSVA